LIIETQQHKRTCSARLVILPSPSGFQQKIFGFSEGKINNEKAIIIAAVASLTYLEIKEDIIHK
jgi:hypothetical protein